MNPLARRVTLLPVILLGLALLSPARPAGADTPLPAAWHYAAQPALFDYDRTAPLDLQVTDTVAVAIRDVLVQRLTYASPVDGRVTASLVAPVRAGAAARERLAGVVFMHWGQGDRSEFLWEATVLARAGAVCVLLDAPWARPAPWTQYGESPRNPGATRQSYIQNIVDLRRAVDLLTARADVDPARLAYVGHSYGATQGGVLAGVEPRFRTFVLIAGLPSLVDTTLGGAPGYDAYQAALAHAVPREQWQAYCDSIGPLTPALYVGRATPASVFMQFGTGDSWISSGAAEAYFAAANQPKTMRRYTCSHEFNDLRALVDRDEWLHEEIGIRPVTPLLEGVLRQRPDGR